MRTLILAAALLGSAPCLAGPFPTAETWSVTVQDDILDRMSVQSVLTVRRMDDRVRFTLDCVVSGPAARTDSRTSAWGTASIAGDVVNGIVEGGQDVLQLPDRTFTLTLGRKFGTWASNVPGCTQKAGFLRDAVVDGIQAIDSVRRGRD
ncbi:hypothetical protein FV226_25165 [Methylobacterium sp. WL12]|uniref:hypothetical protein n=1 Tax=Methylobacterium sp. WL12 TaxID=2603890 RepID=UPI0011C83751|nr:hypothetical protein [Methylobacterium sp. WL12]TXM65392.1 hypothetical protein FV226_25165 [Methylobacterium sp. WL12]